MMQPAEPYLYFKKHSTNIVKANGFKLTYVQIVMLQATLKCRYSSLL